MEIGVYRGGVQVGYLSNTSTGDGSGKTSGATIHFYDNPGPGTFTYSVEGYCSASSSTAYSPSLQVTELKC